MSKSSNRTLIIIGGHEDKENEKVILTTVANRIGNGKLVICSTATSEPDSTFHEYERIFRHLGIHHVWHLNIEDREAGRDEKNIRILNDATGVFFTGGDQLKITSQMGDTPTYQRIKELYERGGVIAGTSAGASVMCETMMVGGNGKQSHRLEDTIKLAPGLGLIRGLVIDQHFAERGRVGRLLGVVAQNPANIGLGIDENTAVVVEGERRFYVLGVGAVYVIDCREVSHSNIAEEDTNKTLTVFDTRLHLLSQDYGYDLQERLPLQLSPQSAQKKISPEAEQMHKAQMGDQ
jgi:cyanophycinase